MKKRSKHQSETYQISVQNRPKINQKSIEHHLKIHSKSIKNRSKSLLERTKSRTSSWEASWGRLRGQHSPKLASKSKEHREEIHAKIHQKDDAIQVSVLMHFQWTIGGKMEACWHQDRIKNRCQLRKGDFQKTIEKQMKFH